jgi:hypothetical protein
LELFFSTHGVMLAASVISMIEHERAPWIALLL